MAAFTKRILGGTGLKVGPLGEEEMQRMKRIGDYVHDHTRRF